METPEPKLPENKIRLIEFMVDHAAEGIYMIGKEGKILYANNSACQKLGYSKEQLLRMDAHAIDPNFNKDPEVLGTNSRPRGGHH